MTAEDDSIFSYIVPSYFFVGDYEIVILQDPKGNALTIKINYNGQ
tara:strand:- start:4491 stop:4625 length:135 start_codon:yes stop_codon:yes gene_type:complete